MLPPSVVNEIRRLLTGEGLSYREIVRITGVSRGTVGLIARGKRPDYEARRVARGDDPLEPTGPPQRSSGMRRTGLSSLPSLRREEAGRREAGNGANGNRPRRRDGRSLRVAIEGGASAALRGCPRPAGTRRDGSGPGARRIAPLCDRSTIFHRRIEP